MSPSTETKAKPFVTFHDEEKKIRWHERGKSFSLFSPGEEEKYHKFAAFFNVKEFLREWHFQWRIDKYAS
jgi:hypothetical protein